VSFFRTIFGGLLLAMVWLALLIGVAWAFGAIWFDAPFPAWRRPLAVVFAASAIAALLFTRPRRWAQLGVAAVIVCLIAWWLTIRPSNNRDWQTDVAQVPYAESAGDLATIHNYRDFTYTSTTEFTPRWETKTVHLSNLRAVDFFTDFWGSPLICHTFLSFDFGPDGYVCASIETRKMVGQSYSAIEGFYRQFALCYILGSERDIVGLRTNYRLEDIRLYRLQKVPMEKARALFLSYLESANALRAKPEWYNALTTNCTTSIRHNIKYVGYSHRWDWQIVINGYIAERAYALGAIDTSLPLPELRRLSLINSRARAGGDGPGFSERIREGLPGIVPSDP
jgi:hypothetical protein